MKETRPKGNGGTSASSPVATPRPRHVKERDIKARGRVTVLLFVDMSHFLHHPQDDANKRLDQIRGRAALAQAIEAWDRLFDRHDHPYFQRVGDDTAMDALNIGFATGVFRRFMLEHFRTPEYELRRKAALERYSKDLKDNFQFKSLFREAWTRWRIFLRVSRTGFFCLRFVREYRQATSILDIAKHVTHLQQPFDIPSAYRWLQYRQHDEKARRSIGALLEWLGAGLNPPQDFGPASATLFYPLQWKMAVEAINWFLKPAEEDPEAWPFVIHADGEILDFRPAPHRPDLPMHDSFVIYRFEDLYIPPYLLDADDESESESPRAAATNGARHRKQPVVPVTPKILRENKTLRNVLTSLLEGTLLYRERRQRGEDGLERTYRIDFKFPTPRWSLADKLTQDRNLASWNDELCVLASRSALILPSRRWRKFNLDVSTIPSATLKVKYPQYWEAVERLIAFVVESRALAQMVEHRSYRLLTEFTPLMAQVRDGMFRGDIPWEKHRARLADLVERSACLRRLTAYVRRMAHLHLWVRAEYALGKAHNLQRILGLQESMDHIRHNIESITHLTDHLDELYLADLAEKSNREAERYNRSMNILSVALSVFSVVLTLIALPSFWKDLTDFVHSSPPVSNVSWMEIYPILFWFGTLFGFTVSVVGLVVLLGFIWPYRRTRRLWREIRRLQTSLDEEPDWPSE